MTQEYQGKLKNISFFRVSASGPMMIGPACLMVCPTRL